MKIAICGLGKLGTKVLNALALGNHQITVFDLDKDVLDKISQSYDVLTVLGDAKKTSLLLEYGINNMDYFLVATDEDEKNILIASFAKKLGCKNVIARVRDPEHMSQVEFIKENMGIDLIVNPDLAISEEIYKYLVQKYTLDNGIFSSNKIAMIQFNVTRYDLIIGKNMIEISKIFPDMLVFAISRNGKVIIPHGDTIVKQDDTIFLVGEKGKATSLYSRVYEYGKYTKLQKVMIMGGGKTGFYLADRLSKSGISVKLVELDKERCYYLTSHLNDVMVLHGDATDMNLLEEENIEEMDAFVSATGFDEENLLLSLIAKRKGIEDVIAKVSRQSYKDLIESMGIEMALNPLDIIASRIVQFIQGGNKIVSSIMIQGQAEIMEIVASKDMKITNKCLKDLKLPQGMLLTAIERDDTAIIPRGETKILAGDKLTIFYLLSDLQELEKLLQLKKLFN